MRWSKIASSNSGIAKALLAEPLFSVDLEVSSLDVIRSIPFFLVPGSNL